MDFYWMLTDKNGVQCVDRLGIDRLGPSIREVAELAEIYPDVIYFMVERVP